MAEAINHIQKFKLCIKYSWVCVHMNECVQIGVYFVCYCNVEKTRC